MLTFSFKNVIQHFQLLSFYEWLFYNNNNNIFQQNMKTKRT